MPLSGSIEAVNDDLQADPALVNREPYGNGWLIKVKPNNAKDMEALLEGQSLCLHGGGGISRAFYS